MRQRPDAGSLWIRTHSDPRTFRAPPVGNHTVGVITFLNFEIFLHFFWFTINYGYHFQKEILISCCETTLSQARTWENLLLKSEPVRHQHLCIHILFIYEGKKNYFSLQERRNKL